MKGAVDHAALALLDGRHDAAIRPGAGDAYLYAVGRARISASTSLSIQKYRASLAPFQQFFHIYAQHLSIMLRFPLAQPKAQKYQNI